MSFSGLLVHDIDIVTPAQTTDRYGDTVKDWAGATRTSTRGWISQRASSEVLGRREAGVTEWVLFIDADTPLTQFDRVEWDGLTFDVDGPPHPAWTPRGEHHVEAGLRIVAG